MYDTCMKHLDGKWLIGVSGGPDSMALLNMCLESNTFVHAAMVNYHHRPEADMEEQGVRAFCMAHHVELSVLSTPFQARGNFEAEARKHRYDFFVKLVKEYDLAGVLIAHQEDDLLETYFMQKERHLVPETYGLAEEMHYQGILVKRPLLSFTKRQLLEYCVEKEIPYWVDSTNNDRSLARNRIRQDLVSGMNAEERAEVRKEIHRENEALQDRRRRMNSMVEKKRIPFGEYRSLCEEDRLTLLRSLLDEKGSHHTLKHLEALDDIIMKKDMFLLEADERWLVSDGSFFYLMDPLKPYCFEVHDVQQLLGLGRQQCFLVEKGKPGVNAVTLKETDFPVTVRNFQDGDVIEMRFGTKPVHRFFIDRKIPLYQRAVWPVVVNQAGEVILVPGLGCSVDHYSFEPQVSVLQLFVTYIEGGDFHA